MYGPKWPFLLMYGSHDMRHTGITQVDGGQRDLEIWGFTKLIGKRNPCAQVHASS